jgi:hypothetical protein
MCLVRQGLRHAVVARCVACCRSLQQPAPRIPPTHTPCVPPPPPGLTPKWPSAVRMASTAAGPSGARPSSTASQEQYSASVRSLEQPKGGRGGGVGGDNGRQHTTLGWASAAAHQLHASGAGSRCSDALAAPNEWPSWCNGLQWHNATTAGHAKRNMCSVQPHVQQLLRPPTHMTAPVSLRRTTWPSQGPLRTLPGSQASGGGPAP